MIYTYLHINETGVFYVGCGQGRRAMSACSRSQMWMDLSHSGYSILKVEEFISQDMAWQHEKELISYFNPICNKAKGGPGSTGCTHTLEAKANIRLSLTGRPLGRSIHGLKNPNHRLTENQVLAIRKDTRIQSMISKDYGVSQVHISRIKSRKKWSHI